MPVNPIENEVRRQLDAYLEAGWEEADDNDIFTELIGLEPAAFTATHLGIREMKEDVRELALKLWRGVRDSLLESLKTMDQPGVKEALILYVIKHSGEIASFFAYFYRQKPTQEQLSEIMALLVLYLLWRYGKWQETEESRANA